ncbi:Geraniol 8-hydroxylase [Bienertia sinuspersici]
MGAKPNLSNFKHLDLQWSTEIVNKMMGIFEEIIDERTKTMAYHRQPPQLSNMPHQAVAELSKKYGPIMSLKLGNRTIIVISSPEIAKERYVNHDLDFSSKATPHARTAQNHDKFSMFWLPIGPKWRGLRKIATIQLFTTQTLDSSQLIRQKKVDELVEYATMW